MRVLFVAPLYAPSVGGAQNYQQAMARRLRAHGHAVTVLTTGARAAPDLWTRPHSEALPGHELLDNVDVWRLPVRYPWPAPYAFGALRRLSYVVAASPLPSRVQRRVLGRLGRWVPPLDGLHPLLDELVGQADIVHATDSSWDGLFTGAADAARRLGRPFAAVPLMHFGKPDVERQFQMVHQLEAYRHADVLFALSSTEARAYAGLGVRPGRICQIAMGVEAQPPQPPADAVAGFRQRYGALGPLVAFLGANTYDKGAFTLANAVAFLNAEGAGVSLICAGPQAHELQAYLRGQPAAVQAALRGRVHLLGVVSEPVKALLLEACTVLALPSRVDTFGIVILEAWARAKPVVGAAAGGIPDLIEAGQTGLLVPFGDVEALAGAIGRLVSGRDLAQRLGAAGQQVVQRRYTWDNTFDVLIAAFDKICTRRIS